MKCYVTLHAYYTCYFIYAKKPIKERKFGDVPQIKHTAAHFTLNSITALEVSQSVGQDLWTASLIRMFPCLIIVQYNTFCDGQRCRAEIDTGSIKVNRHEQKV